MANGTAANGTAANGTAANGTAANGTAANGTAANGTAANGTAVNGTAVNGTAVNIADPAEVVFSAGGVLFVIIFIAACVRTRCYFKKQKSKSGGGDYGTGRVGPGRVDLDPFEDDEDPADADDVNGLLP